MALLATSLGFLGRPLWACGLAGLLALGACAPTTVSRPAGPAQAPALPEPAGPIAEPEEPLPPETVRVGLLLPLSGPNAAIGQAMLDAAQLAVFELADDRFELLPRDTQGTPQGAAAAAEDVVSGGAHLILGPLLAGSVEAVRPYAFGSGLDVLAFTNDQRLAGGGVHVLGFVPAEQVERVVEYARSQGLTRFAALAPRSPYGDRVVEALESAAARLGGEVLRVERYDPNVADLSVELEAVARTPGVEALLIPEGGERLRTIASLLPAYGIDPARVRLLGTGLWDQPGVEAIPELAGGWFAAPDPAARADFERRFQSTYGRAPLRLATLAYDATALATVLAQADTPTPFEDEVLTNPSGFAGVDGLFRLRPDGRTQRGLAVLEVAPGGPRVVDPAPDTFEELLN